ncbi:Topoisomerase 1-associated factor 1 [Hirsutella minnesotensis 3608]|uniref:Topoisomerase 1-associated factor 1 n=1 Tax=Hirsutella minnesotensis 3608 TaxID=1043627 RepID=A0A0F7ZJ62_9HYPO|nr:Topoisomerase 1-associated factor 1 [Hirsutella minnesotensis 3608]
MEPLDGTEDTVHPEVRAHINSLVSALGGISADDDGKYQLGDDALEVLRDIKRWIRFYDEKTNRMDVARCIYEANLIEGDLLPILALWPENSMDNKFRMRVSLACLEVMVPLTWPMERSKEMTVNHHRHMPVLEWAQVQYKKAIIHFDGARILHTAVRAALPSMAIPIGDRTARDQGIIKLVLFFLRNVAIISQPPAASSEGDESQISRSATVDAFSYQDIFLLLLTVASNMGEEFRTEDTTVMEIIYHLVKRVAVDKIFMNEQQLKHAKASELSALMNKESSMLKAYNRKGPTRHSRFGTMVWVKRDDGKMSSLSGQDALTDAATRNQKMDSNKTFKPPRRARKHQDARDLGLPAKLNARANAQLKAFVEEFLDTGFNPLFQHIRKTIDREAPHLMQYHRRQFFYLVAWFLEAERVRRRSKNGANQQSHDDDVGSFNLIAGVLNQEMFVTLNRALHESHEMKDWQELTAVMRCFSQILLTVQEMADSGREDNEEIAENVLSRLFYEESTHDAVATIARNYKDQGFDYLDAATELVHHFLRILEAYSKQNVDMQVRSRKRTRRSKLASKQAADPNAAVEEDDDSANDEANVERTSKERSFDFHRFASKFTPQGVVDTFAAWTKYYRDLSDAQLKRAHRYFYRLAFKQDMGVMLFRVDIIQLLYNMIKGPEPLDKSSKSFKEWEELVKQILRKCFKKIQERPELIVEMLFSKLQATAFFLEYGFDKQTVTRKRDLKPGAELEFRYTDELDKQVAIVVGAMLDRNEADLINWVKGVLTEAESERRSWAAAQEAMPSVEGEEAAEDAQPKKPSLFYVRPDGPSRRTAMFKNSHLRLLMTLSGLQRLGPVSEETPESSWVVPEDVSADQLKDTLHYINQAEFNPPVFDDGASAEQQLKRKTVPRKKAAFDDGDEDGELDDDTLFPLGGPTARKAIDAPAKSKKTRRRRRKDGDEEPPDEEELSEKARKRREREREKARKIKSALYVNEGDDEFDSDEDEAFFARERAIAERAKMAAASAEGHVDVPKSAPQRKRKSDVLLTQSDDDGDGDDDDVNGRDEDEEEEEGEEDDDLDNDNGSTPRPRRAISRQESSDSDDSPEKPRARRALKKRRRLGSESSDAPGDTSGDGDVAMRDTQDAASAAKDGGDEDAQDAPVAATRRPRVRGGFVLDSDDDD